MVVFASQKCLYQLWAQIIAIKDGIATIFGELLLSEAGRQP